MFARLHKENRGATAVMYMLILPIFVVLIFGIFEIWKVMAVQQSLHLGVYKAVRRLSWYGVQWLPQAGWSFQPGAPGAWESRATSEAQRIISEEIDRNSLVPHGYTLGVQVAIEASRRGSLQDLGWMFTVRAEILAPGLSPLLNPGALTLTDRQVSYIEGPSGNWRPSTELPEGWPY